MKPIVLVLALLIPAFANAATGGKLPGEEIVGRADDEDPKAFLKRVKGDLQKVDASIEATKELLSKSKDSPILPDVSLRLAELYVEKSRLLYYRAVEERSTKSGEAVSAPDAKYFKELAIELYKKILKDFPAYPNNDKIRFYLGHEYQELAETPEMLKEYNKLASDYPDSPLVPEALLILGNFYFDKRDMETAEKYYRKVLEKNDKGLAALARYKMGWIEMNKTNHKEALAHFEQAAKSANAGTLAATNASTQQLLKLKNVRREALTDSVQPFTEVKKPEDAVAYYGELADTRNLYAAILEKLGNRYYVQQNWEPSAKIYRVLVTLTHDVERSYEFGQRFFECVLKARAEREKKPTAQEKALGATDGSPKPDATPVASASPAATPKTKGAPLVFVAEDAQMLTETIARYSSSWRIPKKDREAALKEYEVYVRDIATRLQLAAQAEANAEKKKAASWEAARAYKSYLSFFKEPYFKDRSQRKAMEENYALALTFAGKHWEAGRQWEDVAKLDKNNERDAIHDALAEYHEANKERDKIGRFRRVQAREGEKKLGEYYAQVYPDGEDAATIEFNVGKAYYEEGDYESAILLFKQYVKEHPGTKESYIAANLVLDSLVQMENFEALSTTAKAMANDPSLPDPKFRAQVTEIGKQADFRRVGTLLAEGGDGEEDATERLARLAESSKGNELGEKALYTLFITNRDRGEPPKIYEAGERFLATYPKSEFASEVLQSIGRLAIDSADFARAASYYETFAKTNPNDKGAPTLLERAAAIREKMGDASRASANYMALSKFPGALPPKEAAHRAVMAYRNVGDWQKAAEASRRLQQAGGDGPLARFTIGYTMMKAGKVEEGKKELLEAVQRGLAGQSATSEDRDAAAQAGFILAEDMRKQFEAVQLNDVATLQEKLAEKITLLKELEALETEVVKIGSGEWAIAALYRVGEGYKKAADAVRKAPLPPEAAADPAAKAEYLAMVEAQLAGPLDATSKTSFKACLDKANELKVSSPYVAGCASQAAREPQLPGDPPPPRGGRARPPAELTAQLAKDPLNGGLLVRIANGYLSGGDPYTAELIARRAVEVDDSLAEAHTVLAFALLRRGQIGDAAEAFEAAAERAPGQPKEWVNLASHQYAYGDPRKAVESLKRAQNPRSVNLGASDVHPGARRLMTDAPRLMSMK